MLKDLHLNIVYGNLFITRRQILFLMQSLEKQLKNWHRPEINLIKTKNPN